MQPDYDEDRSKIKTTDKLNYRATIQDKINDYLNSIGTVNLERAVMAFRNSVFFEIPGLPFKSEIIEKERELMGEYRNRVLTLVKADRDSWIHPIKHAIYDSDFKEKHYMNLAMFLLDLVAKYDGLMGIKSFMERGETESD